MIALLLATALAGPPECSPSLTPLDAGISVAWVSRLGERTGGGGKIPVFATRDLREWLARGSSPTPGDLLRFLGMRKRNTEPRGQYKVTVFEAQRQSLCRPLADREAAPVGGVATCTSGPVVAEGCGYVIDRRTWDRGPDVYVGRWKELAGRGFCVLTLERFVAEGAAE